ncbi:MAG: hypothetical protein SFZ03_07995 [Candidatus Melainabacteria bacterium]|nr:hypothetical protein [Candidatus Melainabacteria bacterium]
MRVSSFQAAIQPVSNRQNPTVPTPAARVSLNAVDTVYFGARQYDERFATEAYKGNELFPDLMAYNAWVFDATRQIAREKLETDLAKLDEQPVKDLTPFRGKEIEPFYTGTLSQGELTCILAGKLFDHEIRVLHARGTDKEMQMRAERNEYRDRAAHFSPLLAEWTAAANNADGQPAGFFTEVMKPFVDGTFMQDPTLSGRWSLKNGYFQAWQDLFTERSAKTGRQYMEEIPVQFNLPDGTDAADHKTATPPVAETIANHPWETDGKTGWGHQVLTDLEAALHPETASRSIPEIIPAATKAFKDERAEAERAKERAEAEASSSMFRGLKAIKQVERRLESIPRLANASPEFKQEMKRQVFQVAQMSPEGRGALFSFKALELLNEQVRRDSIAAGTDSDSLQDQLPEGFAKALRPKVYKAAKGEFPGDVKVDDASYQERIQDLMGLWEISRKQMTSQEIVQYLDHLPAIDPREDKMVALQTMTAAAEALEVNYPQEIWNAYETMVAAEPTLKVPVLEERLKERLAPYLQAAAADTETSK